MEEIHTPLPQSKAIIFARRSLSTLLLWALVSGIFMSRYSWAFLALIGVLTIVAMVEFLTMLKAAGVLSYPRLGMGVSLIYSGILYFYFFRGACEVPFIVDVAALALTAIAAFTLQLRQPIRGLETLMGIGSLLLGFIYIPFLFNFTARVTFLIQDPMLPLGRVGENGAFLLLWLLAVTKFTDMGAYIVGSMIGRHKMIPHVSPGKTWEGFVGALMFSQLAACGLYGLFPKQLFFFQDWRHVIALGLILAVLAVIGDLAESIVKRSLSAKDSGKMLPGIGGSLDLIDSICFTAPALYFYLKWVLLPTA